jgi:predicted enzyme related to lactoylglutathione lyase
MADAKTFVANTPVWIDLSSTDAAKSRDYYAKLFGWKVELAPDPDASGYALAKLEGKDVAGIGPAQAPGGPSAWMVMLAPQDFPGGRFAIVQDPQGAAFGLLKMQQ